MKRVAVVGAGAVGAVYARALMKGGAHVTFVVRPKYVDDVERGLRMWRVRSLRSAREETLVAHEVVGDIRDLSQPVEQVWLCVPSTGLDDATLRAIADGTRATADGALVVDLSPDLEHRALRAFGRERLVDGIIPFLAWQSPLAAVDARGHQVLDASGHATLAEPARAPGIAWWSPPLLPTILSGPRAREAALALGAGGMSARVVDDADALRAVSSALLISVIATLEASGWSLRACRRRLDAAADEATRAVARDRSVSRGPLVLAVSPLVLRLALRLAPAFVPLPLEAYLRAHFTKVGPQTRLMLRGFLAAADRARVDAPRLRALAQELALLPADAAALPAIARDGPRPDADERAIAP